MNIFVANLSFRIQSEGLKEMFEPYGEVDSAKIIMDRETGRSKGYGFVEMNDDGEAQQAIDDLNGIEIDGRAIVVKEARPREQGGNRGRGGFRNSGGGGYRGGGGGGGYRRDSGGYGKRY